MDSVCIWAYLGKPAPRYSRTKAEIQCPPPHTGEHTDEALADWGFSGEELGKLRESGAIK